MSEQQLQNQYDLKEMHKGKGVAATVLGIISLIACLGPISFICGVIAIFVGAIAKKKSQGATGTAGLVMGIIGTVISVIICLCIIGGMTGIMAPQFIKYTEKTEISSDTQLCDAVRSAIMTAMLDPSVAGDTESADFIDNYNDGSYYDIYIIYESDCKFTESVKDALGIYSYSDFCDTLESDGAETVEFAIEENRVYVRVPGTDIEVY